MDVLLAGGLRLLYTSLMSANMNDDEFGPGIGLLLPGQVRAYEDPNEAHENPTKPARK